MLNTKYTLNVRDFLRGFLLAGLGSALVVIQGSIVAGEMVFNWKTIWMAAVAGFVSYLVKNFFTNDVQQARVTIQKAVEKEVEQKKEEAKTVDISHFPKQDQ